MRHGLQQFLEDEGLTNEIDANFGVGSWRFYRSSTRLPVFGNVARVALKGGSSLGADWWRSGAFLVNGGVGTSFSRERRYKRSVRIAVDRCFPPKSR